MVKVKLSDYIMEQSISDASINDIALEQAYAQIEVTQAICEAYIRQMYYTEAENETQPQPTQPTQPAQQQSPIPEPKAQEGKSGFGETVKRFFISIANWFRRMWIKFTGWLSERKLIRKIKKLEAMPESEREDYYGVLPFNSPEAVDAAVDSFVKDTEEFKNIMNKMMKENTTYTVRDLQEALRNIKNDEHETAKPAEKPLRMNYYDYIDQLKKFLDAYIKHKTEIENTTKHLKQNNYQDIANAMNTRDEKTLKEAYRGIKKLYQMYSAKASRFMRVVMMYMKDAEKIEANRPKGAAEYFKIQGLKLDKTYMSKLLTVDEIKAYANSHVKNATANTAIAIMDISSNEELKKHGFEVDAKEFDVAKDIEEGNKGYLLAIVDTQTGKVYNSVIVECRGLADNLADFIKKNNGFGKIILGAGNGNVKQPNGKPNFAKDFTQKDLDFLELMHLLATALKKTDNFQ